VTEVGLGVAKCGKRSEFTVTTRGCRVPEFTVTTLHAEDVGYSTSSTERGAGVPGARMKAAGRRRSKSKRDISKDQWTQKGHGSSRGRHR
jgi:hypothetical protein